MAANVYLAALLLLMIELNECYVNCEKSTAAGESNRGRRAAPLVGLDTSSKQTYTIIDYQIYGTRMG